MRLARLVPVFWLSSVGLSMEQHVYPPCTVRVVMWPETWSLSMACFVGAPCVSTFDRYIIYACSRNTNRAFLALRARRSARTSSEDESGSPRAGAGGRGGPDSTRPRATLDEGR